MAKLITAILILTAGILGAAEMPYMVGNSTAGFEERNLTLVPSTVVTIGPNATLTASPIDSIGLSAVAITGNYSSLFGAPTTWPWSSITATPTTLAGYGITDAATASQGGLADSAVQPQRTIIAGTGLSGGGNLSANVTLDLANTSVSAGSYGSNSTVPTLTIDAQGRVTAAGNATITPGSIGAATSAQGALADTGIQPGTSPTLAGLTLSGNSTELAKIAKTTTMASASSITLSSAAGEYIEITGNTTITSFGIGGYGQSRTLIFREPINIRASSELKIPGIASGSDCYLNASASMPLTMRFISLAGGWVAACSATHWDGLTVGNATESASGVMRIATNAEVQAGSSNSTATPPSGLASWWTWVKTQAQTFTSAVITALTAGNVTVTGNHTVQGNSVVGDSPADSATLNAETTFGTGANTAWAARKPVAGDVADATYVRRSANMWIHSLPITTGSGWITASANGTTATTSGRISLGTGTTANGTALAYSTVALNIESATSINVADRCGTIWVGRLMTGRTNSLSRLLWGGAASATTLTSYGSLDAKGACVEFLDDGSGLKLRLLVYASTGLVTGDWVSAPSGNNCSALLLLRNGSSMEVYFASGYGSTFPASPITTLSAVPGGTGSSTILMGVAIANLNAPPSAGAVYVTEMKEVYWP